MQINLTDLGDEFKHFEGNDPVEVFGLENDVSLHAAGPLRYSVDAEQVDDQLIVRGKISASMSCRCIRCSCWFGVPAEISDFLVALEIGEEDELVDLTPDMREAIILALPDYPVCRDACKGLCPHCGVDLNEKTCDCRPPADNRWTGLDGLEL